MKILAAISIFAGLSSAQVARTETQSVLVDVLVTDKKGGYVADLTAKDFQIWEDGKEQPVDGLFTEKGAATAARHSIVLLFDGAGMTSREQIVARQVAMRILDQAAAGDPNVAVLDFGGSLRVMQTFTSDVTRAKQAVARSSSGPLSGDTGAPSEFVVRDLLRSLDGLVKNLQSAAGRKSLFFFSPGHAMNGTLEPLLKQVVGAANQSNVAFYPVNMRAAAAFGGQVIDVSTGPAPAPSRVARGAPRVGVQDIAVAADPAQSNAGLTSMLMNLASATGGLTVRQPDDFAALTRITQEQSEFYILSYSPPDSPDGSCHKLRVKVKRDGVNLRSREGYCKRTPGNALSGNAAERSLEQKAQAAQAGNIAATMQAPFFYKGPYVARVTAVIEISPANVVFKKEKNKFVGQLDVLGIADKADGSTGARFSDVVKFDFDTQAQVDQFKRTPYRFENQFDIAPGEYKLTVALGGGGENFGKLQTVLNIEPYSGSEFALSSIALSREIRPAGQSTPGLDEFLIDDRKKLIADGGEVIASASSKLSASGTAGLFVEIYEPLLKTDPQLVVAIQIRLLDRASGEARADTGMVRIDLNGKQGGTVIPLGLNLPLQGLAPGSYALEFQAMDSAGKAAKRTTPFELE